MSSENTEKNAQGIFNFSTYPRAQKKEVKVKPAKTQSPPQTASNNSADSIRIPLHSKESMDQENGVFPLAANMEEDYTVEEEKESPRRYQEDIDTDDEQDAIQRERQEKHRAAVEAASQPEESRWKHGNFFNVQNGTGHHYDDEEQADEEVEEENPEDYEVDYEHQEIVTDLDQPEETHQPSIPTRQKLKLQQHDSIDTNHSRDVGSSVSSLGQHRRGVIEEIDSDQFFLREKGISQDNIDMGRYLSTEIREAFRVPANALADMHAYNYTEMRDSNQSLPETKRKPIKKPKRRKTPHTSQERLRYEPESENDDYNFMPPTRPKRRSKRRSRPEDDTEEVIPYIETISVEPAKVEDRDKFSRYYENNELGGVEYRDMGIRASEPIPAAPPRKHKSLKSLNASEHESIFNDFENEHENKRVNGYPNQDAFMSSRIDEASISAKHDDNIQGPNRPPKPPSRSRSKTKSMSRGTSQADSMFDRTDSIMYDEELREPVVEEPFVQDLRDAMGYAIVDKSQLKNWEHKCCTVPRSHGKDKDGAPERPLRNYSTLGPSRPPRKLSRNMTDEEKENIDITQYIEIDDDRGLQSGEVIQKMQNRPLPAPPRPPRLRTKPLNDITSEENVMVSDDVREKEITEEEVDGNQIDETEVSTQTEPLPADFVCEEVVQEETDKIMTPSVLRKNGSPRLDTKDTHPTENQAEVTKTDDIKLETKLITPTQYTYEEETITHGQLLVEPLNGAQILPNSELSRERIIPITSDEEDTSEIPESFDRLLNPDETSPPITQQQPQKPPRVQTPHGTPEEDVLKTQKLKVSDLDVDRLTVNELVANKIIVSEIDSGNITTHDINSKSGALKLTDIELEPSIVKKLLEQLQESSKKHQSILEEDTASANLEDSQVEEKKTPIDFRVLETSTSQDSTATIVPSMGQNSTTSEIHENTTDILTELQEQEIDSEPALIKDEFIPENCEVPESEINESTDMCDEKCVEPLRGEVFEEKLDVLGETPTVLGSESEEPPVRPPRSFEKKNSPNEVAVSEDDQRELNSEFGQSEDDTGQEDAPVEFAENSSGFRYSEMFEPEIDDEPPPRPPQPQVPYVPSQPPPSFYALRAHHYVENISEDIPLVPRRKRHHRIATISRSSSSEAEGVPAPRRRVRTPEPSISQLSLQLVCACGTSARNIIKRLIEQLNGKFADSSNAGSDSSRHNVQVIIVILLVLIAGLLLLGYGDGRTVHLHHWEYFNPPKDI
ncbi:hypothetical protein WA026_014664 [Henosepilachna vigintioctopunctata]|uniref:Uncharacterized protein n=1 Tax=Henosepilachna vigintioctopunctata TaxID=420089 RepID=A0AAW1VES2_9CUCU